MNLVCAQMAVFRQSKCSPASRQLRLTQRSPHPGIDRGRRHYMHLPGQCKGCCSCTMIVSHRLSQFASWILRQETALSSMFTVRNKRCMIEQVLDYRCHTPRQDQKVVLLQYCDPPQRSAVAMYAQLQTSFATGVEDLHIRRRRQRRAVLLGFYSNRATLVLLLPQSKQDPQAPCSLTLSSQRKSSDQRAIMTAMQLCSCATLDGRPATRRVMPAFMELANLQPGRVLMSGAKFRAAVNLQMSRCAT